MRFLPVLAALMLAAPAFADTLPQNTDLTRICESARLTDLERRECRAMFKNAGDQTAREAALRVFQERINGPVSKPTDQVD